MEAYQTLIDNTSTPWITYICQAEAWRPTNKPQWRIFTVDEDWNIKFANKNI